MVPVDMVHVDPVVGERPTRQEDMGIIPDLELPLPVFLKAFAINYREIVAAPLCNLLKNRLTVWRRDIGYKGGVAVHEPRQKVQVIRRHDTAEPV
jgi:hypothetical protein